MRITTKLSTLITLLSVLAMLLVLTGCVLSYYSFSNRLVEQRVRTLALEIDQALSTHSPADLRGWLKRLMPVVQVEKLELYDGRSIIFQYQSHSAQFLADDENSSRYSHYSAPLMHTPGMQLRVAILDPGLTWIRSYSGYYILLLSGCVLLVMTLLLLLTYRWLRRQWQGVEQLEHRAELILSGERMVAKGSIVEWPPKTSSALDVLLQDLQEAGEQRLRIDTLIRAFAAQDGRTGLNNRLFFDNQLATLLEDTENVGVHGIVMMIRIADLETLSANHGHNQADEYLFDMINMLSTFVLRYTGALLARYFHNDFAVLLPHRTLKEADGIAAQLVNAVDSLPPTRIIDRDDMLHIGISAWHSGMTVQQVIENVELATRQAALLGGNNWSVGEGNKKEMGRGSLRWRTLLENTLNRGGPRLYYKPALLLDGSVHHQEMMARIYDGDKEVVAAEYMPLVQQFGMTDAWDRQMVSRIATLSDAWNAETLAIPITIDSLLQRPFQRWLLNMLLQCTKMQRKRFLFELAEADVCQHISRLAPVMKMLRAFECRIAVTQAGMTVVSSAYIRHFEIEVIKLDPGLVRNIDRRTENQLFVSSLLEVCTSLPTKVLAAGVRTSAEWKVLRTLGVSGGQGDFFFASQPIGSGPGSQLQQYQI